MFTSPIFETLPIVVIAAGILFVLLLHNMAGFIAGGLLILAACIVLYRRLKALGTDPDVMDYIDSSKRSL